MAEGASVLLLLLVVMMMMVVVVMMSQAAQGLTLPSAAMRMGSKQANAPASSSTCKHPSAMGPGVAQLLQQHRVVVARLGGQGGPPHSLTPQFSITAA